MNKSQQIANYIIAMVKSLGKSKKYAISIVSWYCLTDSQDKQVIEIIEKTF